jgi:hypothetical protein
VESIDVTGDFAADAVEFVPIQFLERDADPGQFAMPNTLLRPDLTGSSARSNATVTLDEICRWMAEK